MQIKIFIIFLTIITSLLALSFGVKNTGKNSYSSIVVLDLEKLVNERIKNPEKFENRELRLRGFVKIGSILRMSKDRADFTLEQNKKQLKIHYSGKTQLPDTFSDGAPVRADGILQRDGSFLSTSIEAKCTSKYEVPKK